MKRFISLFLVASVLIFSFAVPSYAAENQWFNVLDYCTPNNSGSNTVSLSNGGTVLFDVPKMEGGYFDFVIQFPTGMTSVSVSSSVSGAIVNFTVDQIGALTWRCYGYSGYQYNAGIPLTISWVHLYNVNYTDVSFLSFKISNLYSFVYDVPVNGTAYFHGNINSSFTYNGSSVGISIPGASLATEDDVRIYLDVYDWAKYDYLEFYLVAREMSVNSIAACLSSEVVPCSVSYLNSVGTTDQVYITVSVDLTGVSRDSAEPLDIAITGTSIYLDSNNGYFGILFASGFLETAGVSKFAQLRISLSQWFNDLRSGIVSSVNSLLQPLNNIVSKIELWGQNIVNALDPSSNGAEDVIDQADQQAGELESGNDVLNNVLKPDLSQTGDITSIVPTNTAVKYTLFLNHLMTAPIISDIVMLSMIFALAGFVLFGKR